MPKPALHTLRWSVYNKIYTLLTPDQQPLELVTGQREYSPKAIRTVRD